MNDTDLRACALSFAVRLVLHHNPPSRSDKLLTAPECLMDWADKFYGFLKGTGALPPEVK